MTTIEIRDQHGQALLDLLRDPDIRALVESGPHGFAVKDLLALAGVNPASWLRCRAAFKRAVYDASTYLDRRDDLIPLRICQEDAGVLLANFSAGDEQAAELRDRIEAARVGVWTESSSEMTSSLFGGLLTGIQSVEVRDVSSCGQLLEQSFQPDAAAWRLSHFLVVRGLRWDRTPDTELIGPYANRQAAERSRIVFLEFHAPDLLTREEVESILQSQGVDVDGFLQKVRLTISKVRAEEGVP